jgi:hypothetical protein
MSFMKPLAKSGLFGLAGLAATSDKKKDKPMRSSLIAEDTTGRSVPSLINSRSIY